MVKISQVFLIKCLMNVCSNVESMYNYITPLAALVSICSSFYIVFLNATTAFCGYLFILFF